MQRLRQPKSVREETAEMVEQTAFDATVDLMRGVLRTENLAQALLVTAAAIEHYDKVAVAAAQQGNDTRMQRSIAATALLMEWLPAVRKEYENVLRKS